MKTKFVRISKKSNKGITLIALVVMIIILIILAGIGLNLVLGEGGILQKAREGKEKQKIASIQDKLELEKGDLAIKEQGELDLDKYLAQIQEKGIITEEDIVRNHEQSVYVTVEDKYDFLVEKEQRGNIKIEYLGKAGNLIPEIEIIKVSSTSHNATIEFTLKYASKYRLTIREEEKEIKEEIKEKVSTSTIRYTFEGLEQGKNYIIKIEAEKTGAKAEKEQKVSTETVLGLTEANCSFSYSPDNWTNQSVTATANVTVDITGYTLQTSQDGKNWDDTPSQTLSENGPVYARLIDSTRQEGGGTTGNVDKIDKKQPVVTEETKATTNTITIKATDDASGIIGYTVTENTTEPTKFTDCGSTTELSINVGDKKQGKTYYVWVKDDADNISEYKEITVGTVTGLTSSNCSFSYSPDGWTNQSVTATAKVNESVNMTGFTLQTSKDGKTWYDTPSQTFEENGTVYARLIDSAKQEGGDTTGNVDKIDKAPPSATIALEGAGTVASNPTVTATVTHTDGSKQSGVKTMKYQLNTSVAALGTNEESYKNTFSNNGQQISLSVSTTGTTTYYLHVLTIDNAKNPKETISKAITVVANKHVHSGNSNVSGGCYTTPVYHKHTGSSSSGGECFNTPVYHTHTTSCYNYTVNGQMIKIKSYKNASGTTEYEYKCNHCGHTWYGCADYGSSYDCGNCVTGTLKCGLDGKILYYNQTCNKDENTIESYGLSCGKNETTIYSYTITIK